MTAPADRPYDIVVFGATSFVGEILCRYVTERHGTDADLRWAIAGRNEQKLEAVAATTGADVPRIVVDAEDRTALAELADSCRVVIDRGPARWRITTDRGGDRRRHRLCRSHR